MTTKASKYKILSLFSNVGIGENLLPENFEVVLANELEKERCEVYRKLYPNHEIIEGDINEKELEIIEKAKLLNINIVIATPPCQSFSIINNKKIENDPRDFLVLTAVRIVESLSPELAIFENVISQANLQIDGKTYIEWLQQKFSDYKVWCKILNTADFGVPQRRKRLFTFISKKHFDLPKQKTHITLEESIGYLDSIEANEKTDDLMHYGPPNSEHHILWAKHTPTGKSAFDNIGINEYYPQVIDKETNKIRPIKGYTTTYRRMHWDEVSYTLTMNHAGPNGSNTLHPGRLKADGTYSDARTLSLREAATIMGLESTFVFPEEVSYRQGMKFFGEGLSPVILRDLLMSWERS